MKTQVLREDTEDAEDIYSIPSRGGSRCKPVRQAWEGLPGNVGVARSEAGKVDFGHILQGLDHHAKECGLSFVVTVEESVFSYLRKVTWIVLYQKGGRKRKIRHNKTSLKTIENTPDTKEQVLHGSTYMRYLK